MLVIVAAISLAMLLFGLQLTWSGLYFEVLELERRGGRLYATYGWRLLGRYAWSTDRQSLDNVDQARNEPFFDEPTNSIVYLDGASGRLQLTRPRKRHDHTYKPRVRNHSLTERINASIRSMGAGKRRVIIAGWDQALVTTAFGGALMLLGGFVLLRLASTALYPDATAYPSAEAIAREVHEALPASFPSAALVPDFCRPVAEENRHAARNRRFVGMTTLTLEEAGARVITWVNSTDFQPQDRQMGPDYVAFFMGNGQWDMMYMFTKVPAGTECWIDWSPAAS